MEVCLLFMGHSVVVDRACSYKDTEAKIIQDRGVKTSNPTRQCIQHCIINQSFATITNRVISIYYPAYQATVASIPDSDKFMTKSPKQRYDQENRKFSYLSVECEPSRAVFCSLFVSCALGLSSCST
jgi:hypothetical protein